MLQLQGPLNKGTNLIGILKQEPIQWLMDNHQRLKEFRQRTLKLQLVVAELESIAQRTFMALA
jgi:hypothetical protein